MTRPCRTKRRTAVDWLAIEDAASARDRAYFAQHPDASCYIRPAVAGELGPPLAGYAGALVIVTQLMPGVRHRRLVNTGPKVRTS